MIRWARMMIRRLTTPPAVCQRMRAQWAREANDEIQRMHDAYNTEEPLMLEWDDGQAKRDLGDTIEVNHKETTTCS